MVAAHVLAKPLVALARVILSTRRWPTLWLVHWIVPLYKKKTVFNAANYRGIHLTAQLSKAMERFLSPLFLIHAQRCLSFGPNQFAYTPRRGARDALAVMVLSWIEGFNSGHKFGIYCSDVAGAFDRVRSERLIAKLQAKGFHQSVIDLIASWLRPRAAHIVVGGARSQAMTLTDMVFQGTVWGPTLWNLFYEDARSAIGIAEFQEMVYADDLNAYKAFKLVVPNEDVLLACGKCQALLHEWGGDNEVAFDPGKETMHVLSHVSPQGNSFRILGAQFDCRLAMGIAVHEIADEVVWKIRTLLRSRKFHTDTEMMNIYKSRVISYVEYRTAALYHACDTALKPIDEIQRRFLRDLGISERDALLSFNLAPLASRRDMAILGMIHRSAIGKGPPQLDRFFQRDTSQPTRTSARTSRRHELNLREWVDGRQLDVVKRSALGAVSVYNLLPAEVIAAPAVGTFQGKLQSLLRSALDSGDPSWELLSSPRLTLVNHPITRFW
jgi:hypothetical protein